MLVLTLRKDPRARQEKARLDREVGGLEPFLEAMPTYIVCRYMYLNLLAGCHKVLQRVKGCDNTRIEAIKVKTGGLGFYDTLVAGLRARGMGKCRGTWILLCDLLRLHGLHGPLPQEWSLLLPAQTGTPSWHLHLEIPPGLHHPALPG